jgi:hypothetical protein
MEYVQQLIPRERANIILYSGIALVVILGLLALRSRKVMKDTTKNRYIIQEDEVLPGISYYAHRPEQVKNLVITSDWYSIWLLCYYFIVAEQPVQPIFFIDTALPGEITRLKDIRSRLVAQFPHKQARLLPTYYVLGVARDLAISRYIHHLLARNSGVLGLTASNREYQIMELAARFSTDYPWSVAVAGVSGSVYGKLLGADQIRMAGQWDNARPECPDGVLGNLRFPIIHLSVAETTGIALDSRNFFYDYVRSI